MWRGLIHQRVACRSVVRYGRSYSSIDDFNKSKTEYSFPYNTIKPKTLVHHDKGTALNTAAGHNTGDVSRKVHEDVEQRSVVDINSILEKDPRLDGLVRGSVEYRDALDKVHQDFQRQTIALAKWYEFNERIRGVGLGILLLLGIILGHQIFMNYDYLKAKIMYKFRFEGDVANLALNSADPARNALKIDNIVARLAGDISPAFVAAIKSSDSVPGLYLCGKANSLKLMLRVPYFDGQYLKDVVVEPDYVAVVTDKGKLYQYLPLQNSSPVLTPLPYKLQKVCVDADRVYGLTTKGQVVYVERLGAKCSVPPAFHNSWLWKKEYRYGKVSGLGEHVKDMQHGKSQLLMLGQSGKLFMCCTNQEEENYGQYGLPNWSPLYSGVICENVAIEMKLANYAIVGKPDGSKTIASRKFTSIACGQYHNLALDSSGNVWTWGLNNHGQCGLELGLKTDAQPVPQRVFQPYQLRQACGDLDTIPVRVYASNNTSYVECHGIQGRQDYLLSFGNGVQGQLGANRYIHACPKPQLVNSIVGLTEYDELLGGTKPIGIKELSVGSDHVFVTLNNEGQRKDVLAFGDNECGQQGNGKVTKSCKPINLPELIEPAEVTTDQSPKIKARRLARRLQDVVSHRLELLQHQKYGDGKRADQVIVAGTNSSALYYRK